MSGEVMLYLVVLVLLVVGIFVFFAVRLVHDGKGLTRAFVALRDKIDGSKRWP